MQNKTKFNFWFLDFQSAKRFCRRGVGRLGGSGVFEVIWRVYSQGEQGGLFADNATEGRASSERFWKSPKQDATKIYVFERIRESNSYDIKTRRANDMATLKDH